MILPAQAGQGRRSHRRLRLGGFTLLEVILASLLMAMVLATIWEVLGVYSHLFEAGGIQARNAQLITAIERQFINDLQGAIEDSPRSDGPLASPALPTNLSAASAPANTAGTAVSAVDSGSSATSKSGSGSAAADSGFVRRFGLQGTATTLRFDVLQTLPEDQLPSSEGASSPGQASVSKPQVPELKTIVYRFTPERNSLSESAAENAVGDGDKPTADASIAGPGLTRWEIGFETPLESTAGATRSMRGSASETNAQLPSRDMTSGTGFEDLIAQSITDDTTTYLPEVRWAAFRYFDGQTWSDSWNSLQQGSLPVAMEVQLILRDRAEIDGGQRSGDSSSAAPDETLAVDDQAALTPGEEGFSAGEGQPKSRLLIRLQTARKRPELKPLSSLASGVLAEEKPPIAPPAYEVPRMEPSADKVPPWPPTDHAAESPDQWLRIAP